MREYLCLNGTEILNSCRDNTYLAWGIGSQRCHPPTASCCWDDPMLGPYVDPITDLAPWYDPAVPESADIIGFRIEDMVLSSPYRRQMNAGRVTGIASNPRFDVRELTVTGWVFTKSCCGTERARQWLFEALSQAGSCDDGCTLPSATIYTCGYRTLRGAVLTGFDWATDRSMDCCLGAKFEFTLSVQQPYLFVEPDEPCFDGPLNVGEDLCNACIPDCDRVSPCCDCGTCAECTACLDCDPLGSPFEIASITGYCRPNTIKRNCCRMVPPNDWSSGTLRIEVQAGPALYPGGPGLRNLSIKAWPDPLGFSPVPPGPCMSPPTACNDVSTTYTLLGENGSRRITGTPGGPFTYEWTFSTAAAATSWFNAYTAMMTPNSRSYTGVYGVAPLWHNNMILSVTQLSALRVDVVIDWSAAPSVLNPLCTEIWSTTNSTINSTIASEIAIGNDRIANGSPNEFFVFAGYPIHVHTFVLSGSTPIPCPPVPQECDACIDIRIECIPANGLLIIDGTSRSAWVECAGTRHDASKYLSGASGPIIWPEVECVPLLVCVESDSFNTGSSSAKIEFWGRERA